MVVWAHFDSAWKAITKKPISFYWFIEIYCQKRYEKVVRGVGSGFLREEVSRIFPASPGVAITVEEI